ATMLSSAAAIMLVVVSLLIAGRAPPRWLCRASFALPALSVVCALLGLVPAAQLAIALKAPLNILGLFACLCIVAVAARRRNVAEAWFLVLPVALGFVTALHDLGVVLMLLDGPVFLSLYYRPLMLIGFAMILMRRLGISLIALDDVNQYLTQRLTEQERVLERMHAEERAQAAQRICTEERQRLTKDLHDGLSGHLVSIIALSEREKAAAIEHSAREALEDLRLVIHSLDIGEDELPLALSGLRERLERQLKRLDIELAWSVVNLPDIPGLSPTHALNILRILQEAITNAVKHARARRIAVYGSTDVLGHGVLTIENDGLPFTIPSASDGHGLTNMRRRVTRLGGELLIEPLAQGTRLAVVLPVRLPAAL
ncbi:MAG: sensor histidine kinase, partial [Gammaproteobacteria bacterium]